MTQIIKTEILITITCPCCKKVNERLIDANKHFFTDLTKILKCKHCENYYEIRLATYETYELRLS